MMVEIQVGDRLGWYNLFYNRWKDDPSVLIKYVPQPGIFTSGFHFNSVESTPTTIHDSLILEGTYSVADSETQSSPLPGERYLNGGQQFPMVSVPYNMMASFMHHMQQQTEINQAKLAYMRMREEREERESRQRIELERQRIESEAPIRAQTNKIRIVEEVAANQQLDPAARRAAGEYLLQLLKEPPQGLAKQ